RGAKVTEGSGTGVFGGCGRVSLGVAFKLRAADSCKTRLGRFQEPGAETLGSEGGPAFQVCGAASGIFPSRGVGLLGVGGVVAGVGCGAEMCGGTDLERAAVLVEEVTGEAAADYGTNLTTGIGVDAGDADEAGLHAGKMRDY